MSNRSWVKSSFSDAGGNNCIQVCANTYTVAIRESAEPGQVIRITPSAFRALVRETKASAPACAPDAGRTRRFIPCGAEFRTSRDIEETALSPDATQSFIRSIAREL
ncbi:DUF397 domain-containing protein [Streptomyces sp. TYQ1024]|nr:DUF397 domain-containing protein [Streptomyces sp. TYQ1024]